MRSSQEASANESVGVILAIYRCGRDRERGWETTRVGTAHRPRCMSESSTPTFDRQPGTDCQGHVGRNYRPLVALPKLRLGSLPLSVWRGRGRWESDRLFARACSVARP